jgi:hypothetical protein
MIDFEKMNRPDLSRIIETFLPEADLQPEQESLVRQMRAAEATKGFTYAWDVYRETQSYLMTLQGILRPLLVELVDTGNVNWYLFEGHHRGTRQRHTLPDGQRCILLRLAMAPSALIH